MYVDKNYKTYKYLVEANDNYVVLTNTPAVNADYQNPQEINVIYQYLRPSTMILEDTRTISRYTTYERQETSQDFFERGDCNDIINSVFIVVLLALFIINGVTKFVIKGGIFNAD